jgi:hypothetical protein
MNLRHALTCVGSHSALLPTMRRFLLSAALFSEIAIWTGVALGANNTVFACVKKSNGAVRIIDPSGHCKKSESPMQWNTTGPQGPTGPTGPQGPGALLLVDATGQPIGTYDTGESHVIMKVGNVPVYITADTSFDLSSIEFFHDSADCSGPRYMSTDETDVLTIGWTSDGKTAYYAQLGSPTIQFGNGSIEEIARGSDASQPGTCSPLLSSQLYPYGPPESLDLTAFTPPFHLQ